MGDTDGKTLWREITAPRRELSHRKPGLKARLAKLERRLKCPHNPPKEAGHET